ncbi:MAG: M56 family metallopeptidase [Pyrinomonadaceae bacterium]
MNSISTWLTQPIFQAVGAALLHFLWQGTLIALLVACLNVLLQNRGARARYAVACVGLVLMLAAPIVTFAVIEEGLPATSDLGASTIAPVTPAQPVSNDISVPVMIGRNAVRVEAGDDNSPSLMPWLVALWMAGVLIFSLRAAGGWLVVLRLRRRSSTPAPEPWQNMLNRLACEVKVSRTVRLCESAIAEVPAVIGWLRPVILVPVGALTGLSSAQIEAVLAHELAHIRRHDYLVNLLQTFVENLLFYHPAIWWVSRRVRIEREHCCDDLAVQACGDVVVYAGALAALEGIRSTAAPKLALAADGGSLLGRVRRLLGASRSPNRATAWVASLVMLISLGAVGLGAHHAFLPIVAAETESLTSQVSKLVAGRQLPALHHSGGHSPCPNETFALNVTVPIPSDPDTPAEAAALADYFVIPETPELAELPETATTSQRSPSGYAEEMASAGYSNLTINELVALKQHGVSGEFVRELRTAGYDRLPVDQLLAFRIHGVSGEFARSMNNAGFGRLEAGQLLAARIHGADPDYLNQMRSVVSDADFEQLLAFRIHGVTVDFVNEFRTFGFGEPTANQLLAARIQGVTGAFIREMQNLGLGTLTWNKVLALRIHGVTPDFVRKVRDRGFTDATLDRILQLKIMGIIKNN